MAGLLPILLGTVGGVAYFATAERDVGTANCSWRDPLSTDLASIAVGGYLAWRGAAIREPWIAAAGGAILAIHISQLLYEDQGDVGP